MSGDHSPDIKFEIGHVLFIDIVGYSKLLIEEQKEHLGKLTSIVLGTAQVRESPDEQLVRLPTGDGMALVFRHSAEEPARCALEIAEALRKHPEIPVRMGIHSGPVSEVTDVSGRTNLAGAGNCVEGPDQVAVFRVVRFDAPARAVFAARAPRPSSREIVTDGRVSRRSMLSHPRPSRSYERTEPYPDNPLAPGVLPDARQPMRHLRQSFGRVRHAAGTQTDTARTSVERPVRDG